jgi:hypothetical protein
VRVRKSVQSRQNALDYSLTKFFRTAERYARSVESAPVAGA